MDARTQNMSKKKLSSTIKGYLILCLMIFVSWLVFKLLTPDNFGTMDNMLSYFQASLIASAGAVGFYLVIVMGMFDFSIGAAIILASILGCKLAGMGYGYLGLLGGCLLTGAIVGACNGFFYIKLRIPSMIITTGLALIYESLANMIAGGAAQTLPADLRLFGQMPGNLILALLTFFAAYAILNYTKIGTYTYAIGSNEFIAKNMGINVDRYKFLAFLISGIFFGIMSVLT
ncbi:ABC transporter permease, partial [Selenomonas bovis]